MTGSLHSASGQNARVACPECGRTVEVWANMKGEEHVMGHRAVMPHTPETPWCQGSGRKA